MRSPALAARLRLLQSQFARAIERLSPAAPSPLASGGPHAAGLTYSGSPGALALMDSAWTGPASSADSTDKTARWR